MLITGSRPDKPRKPSVVKTAEIRILQEVLANQSAMLTEAQQRIDELESAIREALKWDIPSDIMHLFEELLGED